MRNTLRVVAILAGVIAVAAAPVTPALAFGRNNDGGSHHQRHHHGRGGHGHDADVLYKSTVSPLPGNLPSQPFQAQQTIEFGNEIMLTKPASPLSSVVVTMSSWACQAGSWNTNDCVTAPGATFTEPITLNIYNAPTTTTLPNPGALITSLTQTFSIPYRPSASPQCTGNSLGQWYDGKQGCFNGKAVNITFKFGPGIKLPQDIVFGIAYNTSQYGPNPYGALPCESTPQGCPYDSLNVALSQDPTNLKVGSDPNTGKVFWNTKTATYYCDGGKAGSGTFRLDSPGVPPCWGVSSPSSPPFYIPAVQFNEG